MPKNTKGGKGAKKQKNSTDIKITRETPIPDVNENSHIAKITATLGDCRFKCKIIDNDGMKPEDILVHLPRSSKKFGRITNDSYVKISLRDFEVNKGDILYNYNDSDLAYLSNHGYMILVNRNNETDDVVIFSNEENDKNDININLI